MSDQEKQPGKNEITLESDGIMRVYYRGKQTAQGILALSEQGDLFTEQLQERGDRVLILVDVGELGQFGQAEIQAWRRLIATRSFERMAIINLNPALQVVLHFLVKATNSKDKLEVFDDEAAAIDWLRKVTDNR